MESLKVEKYEKEQKTLLEELTLAHAKLVEVKLTINEIEQEKVQITFSIK